jgi:putative hydrolase of the HAD superfamily
MNEWFDALIINDDIINLILKLRENGYNTYILSNAPHEIPVFLKIKDLDKYFDGKIISAEEQKVKPYDEIYNILLDRFELIPEECLFLDDKPENIEGAIRNKINGIVYDYNNHGKMLEELDKYGVNYR